MAIRVDSASSGGVPSSKPTSYTTKSGDTLWSIAKRLLGDGNRWKELVALNKDVVSDPSKLPVGVKLALPTAQAAQSAAPAPAANTVLPQATPPAGWARQAPVGQGVDAAVKGDKFQKVGTPADASGQVTLGKNAVVSGTASGTADVDSSGIKSAEGTAAFKALLGGTTLTGSGQLSIKDNSLTQAQFKAAVQTLFGPNAQLSANGSFDLSKGAGPTADFGAAFKGAFGSLQVGADGTLALKDGKVSGDVEASLQKVLGSNTLITGGKVVFKDSSFQSADLSAELVSQFGKNASLDSTFKATVDSHGLQSATAMAAFKSLIGNTSVDTTGSGLTITNKGLSQAQFQAAVQTTFGPNAKVSADGKFSWSKASGVSADLVSNFKGAFGSLKVDAGGNLALKGGKVSGDVEANVQKMFGANTLISDNKVVFKDNTFQTATTNDELISKFGKSASLDATFKATVDSQGLQSATAMGAFKALAGNTFIDTTGSGLTITNNKLTQAQFQAAIQTTFGPNAKLSADGKFTWNKNSGVSADVVSSFKGTYGSLNVAADGNLTLKGGKVSGDVQANIQKTFGANTLVSDNKVVFKDNQFQTANLNEELVSRFGKSASLDATLQATVDSHGVQSATALAAFKTLVGNTSIDTTGSGLTITNNKLTQAQFQAAIQTTFGPNAQLSANGNFTWNKDSGVSADLVAGFKGTFGSLNVDADGNLSVKNGKASGDLQANLTKVFGSNTVVSDNKVVFKDNHFQTANLNEELISKFGKSGSLDATFKAIVDSSGIQSATATAAFKALVGNTSIDTTGSGLTITNNKLTQAQFQAAIQSEFGPDAKLTADGKFNWSKESGVSADVVAGFKGAFGSLNVDANGNLSLKDGKVSGDVEANIQKVFGSNTLLADNKVVFKDNAFQTANLNDELISKFGKSGSLDATFQATIDNKGVQTATAMAAFKALVGNTSIDTTGTGLTITNNRLSQAQFQAAIQSTFGPNAQLSANGNFTWNKDSGVSADLVSSFKGTFGSLKVDADGNLSVKNGKASGDLQANITKVFGSNTVIADNKVVFADNHFQSATLNEEFVSKFGKSGSLDATFQATVDGQGIKSATAMAAFKALVGNTSIDTSGTGLTITNNKLTQAQFQAAIQSTFGPNAQLSASGNFTWNKDSGVSADLVSSFKGTYGSLSVAADGSLSVKGGKASGDLQANIQKTFGSNTLISDNKVVFQDNHFQSATLNEELKSRFGKNASLDATFQASVDAQGIKSATAMAGFKALVGNTTIDTTGTGLTITNNKLTQAQFQAAIQTTFGPNAQLSANGNFTWSKDSGVSADLVAGFKGAYGSLNVGADGNLTLKHGKVSGDVQANLQKVFGSNTLISDGTVVFNDGHFTSASLNTELKSKFGDSGSLDATFKATVSADGQVDSTISLAAFKRLKQLGKDGAINIGADGTVSIKDGRIDRAEVSGLLSVMAGKTVNLDTQGKMVFADGKWDSTFTSNLAATWGGTTLTGGGTLHIVDGKPELNAKVGALFGSGALKGGGDIEIDGTNSLKVDAKLAGSLGKNTTIDATGALVLDHGKLESASLTTNLVSGGTDLSVGGVFAASDGQKAAALDAQVTAGAFQGSLGIGASSTVKLYTPDPKADPQRAAIASEGGVWAERGTTFNVKGGVGASGNVTVATPIGPVQVGLGFKADASKAQTLNILASYPSQADALAKPPVLVMHPPTTVDQVLAMHPYEQVSQTGAQSLGLGGSVSVGYGVGPANVTLGGQMYYQVTGNMSRDIERLDGNKVRVRFRREAGTSDVKSISAQVGVNADKVIPGGVPDAVKGKIAPIVEKVATAGISKSWESMKEHDTALDVTIDLSTPQGKAAMQHLLQNEGSEAQYWSGFKDSGVTMNSSVTTDLQAKTTKTDFNLGTLNAENMTRWLDKETATATPKDFVIDEAVDFDKTNKAFFPWNQSKSMDMRFVHETKVENNADLPEVGPVATGATLAARIPAPSEKPNATLADTKALFALDIKMDGNRTSLNQMKGDVDPAIALMQQVGLKPEEYQKLQQFQGALNQGVAPGKKPIIPIFGGIGDQRFGKTSMNVETFVAPRGMYNIFTTGPGKGYRTAADFQAAYLDTEGALHGQASVFSRQGISAEISKTLGATVTPDNPGVDGTSYTVTKNGQKIGSLSASDLETMRSTVLNFKPPQDTPWAVDFGAVGKWNPGQQPKTLLHLDDGTWNKNADAYKRSQAFATEMGQTAKFFADNRMPRRNVGESDGAYKARTQAWMDSSLWKNPEGYFSVLDGNFRQMISNDKGNPTAGLTLAKLAGQDGIFVKAQLTMDPQAIKGTIDAGRADVERFGAVDLLAGMGAKLDAKGNMVVSPPPPDMAVALAAAKTLFGDNIQVSSSSSGVTFTHLKFPSNDFRNGLGQLLGGVTVQNGQMKVPASWSPEQSQKILSQVLGPTGALQGGQIVFDNTNLGFIHFGDALSSSFGDAFGQHAPGVGPPKFPTLVPITNEGAKQNWDQLGDMTVRHKGVNADWGSDFGMMGYMQGKSADLAASQRAASTDWVMTNR